MINAATAESRLVRWCPEAGTCQPNDEPACHWEHGTVESHRLRSRRMLICPIKDCEQAYFTQEDFDGHACYSA